jgi:hypothetical protein
MLKEARDGTPGLLALKKRLALMREERENYIPRWRRISDLVAPYRGIFDDDRPNRVTDRDRHVIDPTPIKALETLQAGMQSGLTSPSRPWFKFRVSDPALASLPPVLQWTDDVRDLVLAAIARSNLYDCFFDLYGEVAAFGTGALLIEPDPREVVHGRVLTAGEYCVAYDPVGRPNAFGRKLWMNAGQMRERFGEEALSDSVKNSLENSRYETDWFRVCHLIVPDENRQTRFPYMSVYWEDSQGAEKELLVGGHDEFPVMVPRWLTAGSDTYGYGPGYLAASEAATLHELRRDHLIADKKMIDPPMVAPVSARDFGVDTTPGGMNFAIGDVSHRSLYQIAFDVGSHKTAIAESQRYINQIFYADLFLMIASLDQNPNMTATEAQMRKEEKLQMLGPVTERLTHELLDPAVTRVFNEANRRGLLPPPPEELIGQDVRIEYVSILAMAQISGSAAEMRAFMETMAGVAQASPETLDKLNGDEIVDQLVKMTNVPAAIIRSDEEVAAIREQRAQAAQRAAMTEEAVAGASALRQFGGAVKDMDMSGVPTPSEGVAGGAEQ